MGWGVGVSCNVELALCIACIAPVCRRGSWWCR